MFKPQSSSFLLVALVQMLAIVSEIRTNDVSDTEISAAKQNETSTNGQSMDKSHLSNSQDTVQRVRSGRMMDLDHLVGAIGKEERIAKERSINGDRQSRTLSDDILSSGGSLMKSEGRSKKSGKKSGGSKKMAIKGFIPIVSMEGHKGENPLEDESDDDGETGEEGTQQQGNPDQLLAGYGGQTSMGHASFVGPVNEANPQQQTQWQQINGQPDQPEVARARKLLHGNSNVGLFGGLSAGSKRFISTLVPQQQQLPYNQPQMLQNPMNVAQQQQHTFMDQSSGDCICVPFFQCRNGYLSMNQLSRGQLQQISASSSVMPSMIGSPINQHQNNMHQVPRALRNMADLYTNNDQATIKQQFDPSSGSQQLAGLSPTQPDDQQVMSAAYEQLKKTMESENIEQLLIQQQQQQQQMMNLPLLDERSKTGNQQLEAPNNSSTTSESQERSLLNPLAGRRSSQQRSCGIMRTCCKIPPGISQAASLDRGPHAPRLLQHQHYQEPHQQISKAQQFYPPRPHQLQSMISPQETSFQGQSVDHHQPSTSALVPSVHSQFQAQAQFAQPLSRPHPSHQVGSFMAGRCGTRQTLGVAGRVQNIQPAQGSETTAEFGEFPSHAAILKRLSPGDSLFVCSAVLISNQWLATAAHCIKRLRPEELKVRLGEWDVSRDDEFYPFVELNVRDIIIHPDFQPSSLINDLALLRLESGLDPQQMPHIAPACLTTPQEVFARSRCWLTGWGKDAFGQSGTFQSILKKVDLPVMERQQCESALRYQTKLGKFFRLHQSALCAGGERGKDACEGDGGSGLYCTDPDSGLTKVIGLVSWGVGCGQVGVPGVYTNLGQFYTWIESVISSSGEENLYSDRSSSTGSANSIPDSVFKSLVSERSNQSLNETLPLSDRTNSNSTAPTINPEDPQQGERLDTRIG